MFISKIRLFIIDMPHKITHLKNRILTQELYSNKDCLIFNINYKMNKLLLVHDVCKLTYDYFIYIISSSAIKACHPLAGKSRKIVSSF